VFSIANGYDADIWDDTLLIRQYERACQSSRRELKRRRAEAGKRKKNWELGNGCRVVYENDGLEYEATIVKISGRKATVRLHGYKEELEVPLVELADSLGQHYIQEQIVEAQMEVVSEDPYTGSVKPGAHCRAFWSLDDAVYEATILSQVDDKVTVRFIGYDNEDTVYIEDLLESKGQEWRDLQIEDAKLDYEEKNNNFNVDLDKLIQDNSHILSKLPEIPNMDNLSLEENSHKSKSKKKESKKDKLSSSEEKKHKSDKKEKHREKKSSDKHSSLHPDIEKMISEGSLPGAMPGLPGSLPGVLPGSLPGMLPGSLPGMLPGSLPGGLPGFLPSGMPSLGLPETPSFLGMPSPLPDLNSYSLAGQAGLMPSFLGSLPGASVPGLMGASMITPPPPPNNDLLQSSSQKMLHSMLTSWYLAGYHTGLYLGSQQQTQTKEHKKKKSKK